MIGLAKTEEPDILKRNAIVWTQELLAKINSNEEPTKYLLGRYSDPQIKAALLKETHGKCAYCESPLRHVTYGDVEHIISKASQPSLRFAWHNLTIACDVCNTKKGDAEGLVDPYQCDPTLLFDFYGDLIWAKFGIHNAELTEYKLELNRPQLVERRRERIEYLRHMVASAMSKPTDVRDAMLRIAERETQAEAPFSACGTAAFRHMMGD